MNRHGNPSGRTRYAVNAAAGKETILLPGWQATRAQANERADSLNANANDGTVYDVVILKVA